MPDPSGAAPEDADHGVGGELREDSHLGGRDLTRWESLLGRWSVRLADRISRVLGPQQALVTILSVGAVISATMTWVASEVYEAVTEVEGVSLLDEPTLEAMKGFRSAQLDSLATAYTNLGGQVGMPILAVAAMVILAHRRRSWTPVILISAAGAGSLLMTVAGKQLTGRARPPLADAVPPYEYSLSFPSGHTLNAVVIAGVVAYLMVLRQQSRRARALTITVAAVFAFTMGVSRVYLGHHWLTDVLGAWLLGGAWLAAVITAHRLYLTVAAGGADDSVEGRTTGRMLGRTASTRCRGVAEMADTTPQAWRAVSAAIVLALACVLAALSVASVWASTMVSDTDRYVAAVAPLAEDPEVRAALADTVTTAVTSNLGVEEGARSALEAITGQPDIPPGLASAIPDLAAPVDRAIEDATRARVETLLASPRFPVLWTEANRATHQQVVAMLEGTPGGVVSAQDAAITLNLAPIVAAVQADLVDRGFGLARAIPVVDRSFVLAESPVIARGQAFYRLLTSLGVWLPVVTLALLAAGVGLARDRRRACVGAGLGVAASMLALGIALMLLRGWYLASAPADVVNPDVAAAFFDALVGFLWTWLRVLGVLGLLVAVGGWLVGPSFAARRIRSTT